MSAQGKGDGKGKGKGKGQEKGKGGKADHGDGHGPTCERRLPRTAEHGELAVGPLKKSPLGSE